MEWLNSHLSSIIGGGAALVLMPIAWKIAKAKVPGILARWVVAEVEIGMKGGGATDTDLQELVKSITMSLVLYAEKKLPDEGLGQQKTDLILSILRRGPWLTSFVNANERNIRELIDLCVKEMNDALEKQVPPK